VILAATALFQMATKGIRLVMARAEALAWQAPLWLNLFVISNYDLGARGDKCRACRSCDKVPLFKKLPFEKELLQPQLKKSFDHFE
jgi:hypothetical protein